MTWLVAIIGSVTGFLFGYDEGIIAGSLAMVKQHFALSHTHVGLMASALPFGALLSSMFIGALLASRLVKYFGRRDVLFCVGILFFLGTIGTALADKEWVLILCRFILGIAIGIAAVTTPLYLAETASEKLRGAIVAIYQLAITLGIVCAYAVNYILLQHQAWRAMFASSALPSLILVVGIYFLPESPRWLMSIGKRDKAAKALKRLRKKQSIDHELLHIETTLANEPSKNNWRLLFQRPLFPVLSLGVILFCLQQLCGINVVIYYAPEIFSQVGFANITGQVLATIGIGLVNLLVTIGAVFFVDKIGRRRLLLIGFTGTFLSLAILSTSSFYHVPYLAIVSVACLVFYIISFAISVGPVPIIAMSEIFPLHVRGVGMGLSSMSNWAFNTFVVFTFPILQEVLGIEITFGLYALVCLIGWFYTYYWMPETKNLSLEDIEDYLTAGKPLRCLGRSSHTVLPSKVELEAGV